MSGQFQWQFGKPLQNLQGLGGMLQQGWQNLTGQNNNANPQANPYLTHGMDPSTMTPEQITQTQNALMAGGFDLPQFGADGDWGEETQGAYNAWAAANPVPSKNNETTQSVDSQANTAINEATEATTSAGGADASADAALAAKKATAGMVGDAFASMDFGTYGNYK